MNTPEISLLDLLRSALQHWRWFFVSVCVCIACGVLFLLCTPKSYERTAELMLREKQKSLGSDLAAVGAMMGLGGMGSLGGGQQIENDIQLLQSHRLIGEVVRRLNLGTTYDARKNMKRVNLYGMLPVEVRSIEDAVFSLRMEVADGRVRLSRFVLTDSTGSRKFSDTVEATIGDTISTPVGRLALLPRGGTFEGTVRVRKASFEQTVADLQKKIKIAQPKKQTSLIQLKLRATNPMLAADVLNTLQEAYETDAVSDKQLQAQTTIGFIDDRLGVITQELSGVDERVEAFKRRNALTDIQADIEAGITERSEYKAARIKADNQVVVTEYLRDYLLDPSKQNQMLPGLILLESPAIATQIENYNLALQQAQKLTSDGSKSNPAVHSLQGELKALRSAVLSSLDSHLSSLELQQRTFAREEQQLRSRMASVPEQEKLYLDLERKRKITQELYLFLLTKREESALTLMSAQGNFRVVDRAYGLERPVAPRKSIVLGIALLIGLILPTLWLFIKQALNARSPEDRL